MNFLADDENDIVSDDNVSMDELVEAHEAIDQIDLKGKKKHVEDDVGDQSEFIGELVDRASDDGFEGNGREFHSDNVSVKYRTEAQVPKVQRDFFDQYQGSYGRHVALSNTKRVDNVRHLNALDLQYIYDRIPTLRHRGNEIRVRETSEYQMCRGNQEIGGFEAKLGVTNIKREDVDVKQSQSLFSGGAGGKKKKKGMLSFLRR